MFVLLRRSVTSTYSNNCASQNEVKNSVVSRWEKIIDSWQDENVLVGSRDGAVVRALASPQCGLGSIPGFGVICGLSLLLVLVLAPRGFSPGTPVFPSPQKPTLLNFNSIWKVSPISALR